MLNSIWNRLGFKIDLHRKRSKWLGEEDRFSYQKQYVNFDIKPSERVLDVGSGGYPFPYATVVADRFIQESPFRYERLVTAGKPLIVADIHNLGFRDKAFDFLYCSHVLEVIENPIRACKEIIRVAKRGYIETPTAGKDMLFAWARGMQRWHVVAIGQYLCFFEYSERELDGIRSSVWRDLIFSKWDHPVQEIFSKNQDLFNVMFNWVSQFSVFVFRQDGSIQTLNADDIERSSVSAQPCRRNLSKIQLLVWLSELLGLCGVFDQLFI